MSRCPECYGKGELLEQLDEERSPERIRCPRCDGVGSIVETVRYPGIGTIVRYVHTVTFHEMTREERPHCWPAIVVTENGLRPTLRVFTDSEDYLQREVPYDPDGINPCTWHSISAA